MAFHQGQRIAAGSLREIAFALAHYPADVRGSALIFDATSSEPADIHFEGALDEILESTAHRERAAAERRSRGRPKLGVVAREVTLLPRHWEWLNEQPGGASVALRRLVDEARKASSERDIVRRAQESTYRFMAATLGNAPGFEEAIRALFQGDADRFHALIAAWPDDLREHTRELARGAFWLTAPTAGAPALPDATGA
ncbi:MAG: DUF2239 family protein [Gemmatimonadetes bacterium]|nr:DUF2239 family protein [Gemmatimonadota bacterium]